MSRTTRVLGFSVPPTLVEEVEQTARQERRTRSELFREMWRVYRRYRLLRDRDRWVMTLIEEANSLWRKSFCRKTGTQNQQDAGRFSRVLDFYHGLLRRNRRGIRWRQGNCRPKMNGSSATAPGRRNAWTSSPGIRSVSSMNTA
ncbi:MAG: ribbon-helix-helix protein, CopG family [Bryobacteraceae bacterium]